MELDGVLGIEFRGLGATGNPAGMVWDSLKVVSSYVSASRIR